MFLSVIEFPSNFEYGGDVISSVGWLKMLEVPSHYVYNFNSVGHKKYFYTLFAPRVTMRSVWTVSYYCHDERGDGAVANFEKKSRTVGFTNWAHLGRDCFAKIAISSQAKSKKSGIISAIFVLSRSLTNETRVLLIFHCALFNFS